MKILLGMSGGLDSTFAAHLLREQGHEVLGCALRMHDLTPIDDARLAAEQAGIPLLIIDAAPRFEEQVIRPFLAEYSRARTPNPCVLCNPQVKIELLCAAARERGLDAAATGHYSHVLRDAESGRYFVRRAIDPSKDQSYALWGLRQDQLAMLHLPLAGETKSHVRACAEALGFRAAQSKESMENCFIAEGSYREYMEKRGIRFPEGDFLDTAGNVIGRHRGIIHYTIGQRKGLGLSLGHPIFVVAIDPEANTVTLGTEADLMTDRAEISGLVFQKKTPIAGTFRAEVKIRYSALPIPAEITVLPDLTRAHIRFEHPVRAVTPGQSAVGYEGEDVMFGGVIVHSRERK